MFNVDVTCDRQLILFPRRMDLMLRLYICKLCVSYLRIEITSNLRDV